MPGAILDRRFRPRHDTREGARGQAKEEGWSDTMVSGIFENAVQARHGEIVPDPGGNDDRTDDSCLEIHGNEGWIGNYERTSKANEWSEDVSDKDISGNK